MAIRLGMQGQLFYGAAGSTAGSEAGNVRSVTINLETGESDVTTRGNDGWVATVATLKNGSLDFEMIWDTDDAFFTSIYNAWNGSTAIALFASDGAGSGLDADFTITNFSRNEELTEAMTISVTAKPTYSTRAPVFVISS